MLGKFKIKGTDQTSQPSLGTCSHPINQYQDCKGLKIKKIKKLTKYKRVPMIIEREKQDRYKFFFFLISKKKNKTDINRFIHFNQSIKKH